MIELRAKQQLIVVVDGDDIVPFIELFGGLLKSRQASGFVKTIDLSDEVWEVVEALGEALADEMEVIE